MLCLHRRALRLCSALHVCQKCYAIYLPTAPRAQAHYLISIRIKQITYWDPYRYAHVPVPDSVDACARQMGNQMNETKTR